MNPEKSAGGKVGVGIIGAGLIAPMHLAGFQQNPDLAEVVMVCDTDETRASDLAALCGAETTRDYHALLSSPRVDLVDVLLPHHLHYQVALDVLAAGKHLLLEKPVAVNYEQSVEIVRRAQDGGLYLGIAENTRSMSAYFEADKMIRAGKLGDIRLVRTFLPANERMRLSETEFWGRSAAMGGGCLLDSGVHTFYLLKWLFGEVEELSASTSILFDKGSEVEDNAEVHGRLACGAEFHCGFTFTAEIPHSERLEVYGTHGSIIMDQLANPPGKFFAEPMDFDGSPIEGVPYDPMGWHYFSIVEGVGSFLHTFVEKLPPVVDPQDCCYAVKVAEKAYKSARNGNRILKME